MEFLEFKDLLFKKAIENGFNECEIYYRNGDNISISAYDGEVEKYDICLLYTSDAADDSKRV